LCGLISCTYFKPHQFRAVLDSPDDRIVQQSLPYPRTAKDRAHRNVLQLSLFQQHRSYRKSCDLPLGVGYQQNSTALLLQDRGVLCLLPMRSLAGRPLNAHYGLDIVMSCAPH